MSDDLALGDLAFVPQDAVSQWDDRDEMDAVVALLDDEGFAIHRVTCATDAAMLAGLGRALDWQAQFGQPMRRLSLDAFADALRGVPSEEGGRVLLILDDFRAFEARDPRRAEGIVEAIRDAAADHLEVGRRLLAFICTEETENMTEVDPAEDAGDPAEEWLRHG